MVVCGIKFTHDGSITIIDGNKLISSTEVEKIDNNPRYSAINDAALINNELQKMGYKTKDIDYFVIDGWGGSNNSESKSRSGLTIRKDFYTLTYTNLNFTHELPVSQYEEKDENYNVLTEFKGKNLKINNSTFSYSSFLHVTGHICSSYFCSPFAKAHQDSYILIWDGGVYPRLYYFDSETKSIENLGPILFLLGDVYTTFAQNFGPFKSLNKHFRDYLSLAGKVMAYIALGNVNFYLLSIFNDIYKNYDPKTKIENAFTRQLKEKISDLIISDEDILHSFHQFIAGLLVEKLKNATDRFPRKYRNLCLGGGCALNIKWNSYIRDSSVFDNVFVPPFPNDSGSSLGTACAKALILDPSFELDWDVYSGPFLKKSPIENGWSQKPFSLKQLAYLLYSQNEPIIFLNGRAELGPRALGNRSIIASPFTSKMKATLNRIKKREFYRPISPVCLVDKAQLYFDPGTPEPFMLFEHTIKKEFINTLPAICHLDNTVRLQTVDQYSNPNLYTLLVEFEKISNFPILCNTSANLNGSGFFPDVLSATKWNSVNYIWSENTLFEKDHKITF